MGGDRKDHNNTSRPNGSKGMDLAKIVATLLLGGIALMLVISQSLAATTGVSG